MDLGPDSSLSKPGDFVIGRHFRCLRRSFGILLNAAGNLIACDLNCGQFEEANVGTRRALRRAVASKVSSVRYRRYILDLVADTEHIAVPQGHIFALLEHNIGMTSAD